MGFLHLCGVRVCVCVCVCVCGSNSGNYKLTVVERVEDKNRDHGIQIRICKGSVASCG